MINEQLKYSLNIKGHLICPDKPLVMGILNLTPDSFYTDSSVSSNKDMLLKAEKMLEHGATILDIGGQSTRPGAERLSAETELARVLPGIKALIKEFPQSIVSIDTFYGEVAQQAVNEGAAMVNDISAGSLDNSMFGTVAKLKVPYVLMHMQGEPQTMQKEIHYTDVVKEVTIFFSEKINELRSLGINDILLDVGFGFGKKLEHNYALLHHLHDFSIFEMPLLAGLSRKKMIQNITGTDAANALNGTTAANMIALMHGASVLRVHDVQEAVEAVNIFCKMIDFK
jgi:dihydropteroate synthase